MNQYAQHSNYEAYKRCFQELVQKDSKGVITHIQKFLQKGLSLQAFQFLSTKLLYRVGYRLENWSYARQQ